MSSVNLVLLARLAWRNVWRNGRRTAIMLAAIGVGAWLMIFMAALMRGMVEQQVHDTIFNLTGHVQIHAPGYLDDPAIENSMSAPGPALLQVLGDGAVENWTTRVRLPAVIASERESAGVTLVGIEPQAEQGLSFIAGAVGEGRSLQGRDDDGLILGRRLAERLETSLGKRVVIMAQDRDNEVADRGFKVVGIFDAEIEATESAFVFTGRGAAQTLLKMGDEVSELALMTTDRERLGQLVERLRDAAPGLEVADWATLEPLLKVSLELYDGFMLVWFFVVFLAMSFGLVNTLLMAVYERTRELGLFQALGMRPRAIVFQVLLESLVLLGIGLAVGNAAAWLSVVALSDGLDLGAFAQGMEWAGLSSMIYPLVIAKDVVNANVLVVVLGLIASLYPAWRAARHVPVEAITRA